MESQSMKSTASERPVAQVFNVLAVVVGTHYLSRIRIPALMEMVCLEPYVRVLMALIILDRQQFIIDGGMYRYMTRASNGIHLSL